MRFEHFALNVPDARAHVAWYVRHLGLTVVRQRAEAPYTTFLADETGRVIVELYSNPSAPFPDYAAAPPLVFHIAFVSTDTAADRARLESAGATFVLEDKLPDGSTLLMLRDPWGVPLQFCHRAEPFR
jgi:catechol 2,3-dioxygenase-like lactoylglutathione lyase family enzyme